MLDGGDFCEIGFAVVVGGSPWYLPRRDSGGQGGGVLRCAGGLVMVYRVRSVDFVLRIIHSSYTCI